MALRQAREYLRDGYKYVVDMDLEKFFDRVNHDILMERLSRDISDKRLLRIIRRYLEAGLLQNGIFEERRLGMPQGGNLSPLLSNILLDELDKELEKRGHKFCRYADDCNIYRTYALTANHNYVLTSPCIPLSLMNPAMIELNN